MFEFIACKCAVYFYDTISYSQQSTDQIYEQTDKQTTFQFTVKYDYIYIQRRSYKMRAVRQESEDEKRQYLKRKMIN